MPAWLDRLLARKPKLDTPRSDSGRQHFDGFLEKEEQNVDLQGANGLAIFDRMYRTDPDVRRAVWMCYSPIVAATWSVDPAGGKESTDEDAQVADDVAWALGIGEHEANTPTLTPWAQHLAEMFPVLIRSGHCPFEVTWTRVKRDGRDLLVPHKLGLRLPRTINRWHLDDAGDLTGIEQFRARSGDYVDLHRPDLLYYRVGAEGDNWEGTSMLRPVYKPWLFKDKKERLDAIADELEAIGLPLVFPPTSATIDDSILTDLEAKLAALRRGELSYLVMPGPEAGTTKDGSGWTFRLEGLSGGSGSKRDPTPMLNYHRDAIAAAFIQEFMRLGQSGEGARATADVQQDPFLLAVQGVADVPRIEAQKWLITRFVRLNYGPDTPVPSLSMSVTEDDLASLVDVTSTLVTAGVLHPDEPLEDFFRERGSLPAADPKAREERKAQEEEARQAELAAGAQPAGAERVVETTKQTPAGREREKTVERTKTLDGDVQPAKGGGQLTVPVHGGKCGCDKTDCDCDGGDSCTWEGKTLTRALARSPKAWESTAALDTLKHAFDTAPDTTEQTLSAHVTALAAQIVADPTQPPPQPDPALLEALDQVYEGFLEIGSATVHMEAHPDLSVLDALETAVFTLNRPGRWLRGVAGAHELVGAVWRAIVRANLDGADPGDAQDAGEQAGRHVARRVGADLAGDGIGKGREQAATSLAPNIKGARYTSILDTNRCAACEHADDDVLRPLTDPVRLARKPPNSQCESTKSGVNRCRCIEVFEFDDEAPAYLEAHAAAGVIWLAKKDWDPEDHPRDENGRFIAKLSGHTFKLLASLAPAMTGPEHDLHTPSTRVGRAINDATTKKTTAKKGGKEFEVTSHTVAVSGKGAAELLQLAQTALNEKLYTQTANPSSTKQGLERAIAELLKASKAAQYWADKDGDGKVDPGEMISNTPAAPAPAPKASAPDFANIPDVDVGEPSLPPTNGKTQSAGLILLDDQADDLRVWLVKPKGGYGGYQWTFPKGGVEPGLTTQQTAHKELWEESGLTGEVETYLGDYAGDTTHTRFYTGVQTGGTPTPSDETEDVQLVTLEEAAKLLNKPRDKKVLADLQASLKGDSDNLEALAAAANADPIAKLDQLDLADLTIIGGLGGTTGAKLAKSPDGDKYVVKRGKSPGHIREEYAADKLYQAVGVSVPEAKLIDGDHPTKIALFKDGKTLDQVTGDDRLNAIAQLQSDFAMDALLANYDVVGLGQDNILWDGSTAWRIDNGGSLRYRAQGKHKHTLTDIPTELWTMRQHGSASAVFGGVTDEKALAGARLVLQDRKLLEEAATPELLPLVQTRLDGLQRIVDESDKNRGALISLDQAKALAKIIPAGKTAPEPTVVDHNATAPPDPGPVAAHPDVAGKLSAAKAGKQLPALPAGTNLGDAPIGSIVQFVKGGKKWQVTSDGVYGKKLTPLKGGPTKSFGSSKSLYAGVLNADPAAAGAPEHAGNVGSPTYLGLAGFAKSGQAPNAKTVSDLPSGTIFEHHGTWVIIDHKAPKTNDNVRAWTLNEGEKFSPSPTKAEVPAQVWVSPFGISLLNSVRAKNGLPPVDKDGNPKPTAAAPAAAPGATGGSAPSWGHLPTGSAAASIFESVQHAGFAKLNNDEKAAIKAYTGSSFAAMSGWLRNNEPVLHDPGNIEKTLERIHHLDNAFRHMPAFAEDTVIWRGVSGTAGDKMSASSVGQLVQDKGYMSSSVNRSTALSGVAGTTKTLLKIRLPKGHKGLWVNMGGSATSQHPGEQELLLPRGMVFKVVGREDLPGGKVELAVEPIGPPPA